MSDTLELSEPIRPAPEEAEPADVDAPAEQSAAPAQPPPPPFEGVKWRVKVGEKEYGPYPRSRLIEFLKEGRVGAHTLLCCGADKTFVRADQHKQLRWDFNAPRKRKFGEPKLEPGETEAPVCNYFVAGRLVSDGARFERMLQECGRVAKISGDMWVLRSRNTVHQIRHRLASILKGHDQFVIVNATRDRLAWYNIGVEADINLRDVWDSDEVD